jgi:biopolymer transport protein ExbD
MQPERRSRLSFFVPLGILLLLIAAFFLGSRFPYTPRPDTAVPSLTWELPLYRDPQVKVGVSRNGIFVWNQEKPAALEQLPARIAAHKEKVKHRLGPAEVSGEDLTRFDQVIYALDEPRKGGFPYVTVATKPKRNPEDPY